MPKSAVDSHEIKCFEAVADLGFSNMVNLNLGI